MGNPEESRELPDVTIRVRETSPGRFEQASGQTRPDRHLARNGFTVDTTPGLKGTPSARCSTGPRSLALELPARAGPGGRPAPLISVVLHHMPYSGDKAHAHTDKASGRRTQR